MDIKLSKVPKNPIIIEGFPGIGLVGTIATEFLVEHLNAKSIGKITGDEVPPMVAVHDKKVVRPMEIFYDSKNNILIFHVISGAPGEEWKIVNLIDTLASKTKAKEIISLESVGTPYEMASAEGTCYYYSFSEAKNKKFEKIGLKPLQEGIVMGVTGALMQYADLPLSCIFAETYSKLPDSKAAAHVIDSLNKYLNLKIDTAPLLESAQKFEEKIKGILEKSKEATDKQDRQRLSYLG